MSIYNDKFVLVENGSLRGLVATVEKDEGTELKVNPYGFCKREGGSQEELEDKIITSLDTIRYTVRKEDAMLLYKKGGAFRIQGTTNIQSDSAEFINVKKFD